MAELGWFDVTIGMSREPKIEARYWISIFRHHTARNPGCIPAGNRWLIEAFEYCLGQAVLAVGPINFASFHPADYCYGSYDCYGSYGYDVVQTDFALQFDRVGLSRCKAVLQ